MFVSDDATADVVAESEFEPPVLFDLGSVYEITFGSLSGCGDASGQAFS